MMRLRNLPIAALLLVVPFSGCLDLFGGDDDGPTFGDSLADHGFALPEDLDLQGNVSADDLDWPDFSGTTLRILDHGAFWSFGDAADRFEALTGAKVEHTEADDTGTALNTAIQNKESPLHDIIYGLDNTLYRKAAGEGILQAYKPLLAPRLDPANVFFGADTDASLWWATPVDHGYIGLNVFDADKKLVNRNATIQTLWDVRANADLFVTQDPHTSTPGLGFMLTTIARFGEDDAYDWQDYWTELFVGPDGESCTGDEIKVTSGWTEAYQNHFTGGYGNDTTWNTEYVGGYPIVTSYVHSPAYEAGGDPTALRNSALLDEPFGATFHQVQTMGVLAGTTNRAVAEAWIEFTLTDDFQALSAPANVMYPAVAAMSADDVYGDADHEPGTFTDLTLEWNVVGAKLNTWLDQWQLLKELHAC